MTGSAKGAGTNVIIWRRWGILVPVVIFAALFATQSVVDAIAGEDTYSGNRLYQGVALIIGGALVWGFAEWETRRSKPRVLVDKETGQEVTQTDRSDLFFIPIRYWGWLSIGVGVVFIGSAIAQL